MTKHSHEEYLNWIDKAAKACYLATDSAIADSMQVYYKAIRAVLVRHERNNDGYCNFCEKMGGCGCCSTESPVFPCSTYTDVTDSLDEVMG